MKWTYGCEHEFGDWDTRKGWEGFGRDPEPNACNSNGIATDPSLKSYPFGGEINTPATETPEEQIKLLQKFLKKHPRAVATHRAGLHVHIRMPGLKDNLDVLKKIQKFISENTDIYHHVDPLPIPTRFDFPSAREHKEAVKRQRWMRMSHWTSIPINRVQKQLQAKSIKRFFELEVPQSKKGSPLWHAQPRAAISLRQLLQTDTIEFRHFSASVNPEEVLNAIHWCRDYLLCALDNGNIRQLFDNTYKIKELPKTEPFVGWKEKRWHATSITKNKRDVIEENIRKILDGTFDAIGSEGFEHLIP